MTNYNPASSNKLTAKEVIAIVIIGIISSGIFSLLGLAIGQNLISAEIIISLDQNITQLVADFRSPKLIQVFIWITTLGVWQLAIPLLAASIVMLIVLRRSLLILPLLVSSLGGTAFSILGKLAFQRPRPAEALLFEHSYAFPSSHATTAIAFYGFLGYLLIRSVSGWQQRITLFFITGLVVILLGLSRIILGVHYLSDILAGYLVGGFWLIIAIGLTEWLIAGDKVSMPNNIDVKSRARSRLLAVGALVYVASFILIYQPVYATKLQTAVVQLNNYIEPLPAPKK